MNRWLARVFHRQPVADILADQLFEAERLHAEHLAAGEMHCALAAVYERRAQRIRSQQVQGTELRAVK